MWVQCSGMDLVTAEGGKVEVVHRDTPAVAPSEHLLLLLTMSMTPALTINRDIA